MLARDVDERTNKVGIPDVRHTGGASRECAIGENEVEEQLALVRGDVASSHNGPLDRTDPVAPECILQDVERVGREVELGREKNWDGAGWNVRQAAHLGYCARALHSHANPRWVSGRQVTDEVELRIAEVEVKAHDCRHREE